MKFKKDMVKHKSLLDKHDHFFLWHYLHQAWFVSNVPEKMVDLTALNILKTTRAVLINFCLVDTTRCQILFWVYKLLCLFQQIFTYGKVKDNIIKRQKISALKCVSLPRSSKKWIAEWKLVMYREWFIWTKDHHHHHEPFTSQFYKLFRMYDMVKD